MRKTETAARRNRKARKRYWIPITTDNFIPAGREFATPIRTRTLLEPTRIQPKEFLESPSIRPPIVFGHRTENVPSDKLQSSLKQFLRAMEAALEGIPSSLASYHLDTVELAVEVSAEGSVSLLGTGGKLGGKGSLTLKLQRRPASGGGAT